MRYETEREDRRRRDEDEREELIGRDKEKRGERAEDCKLQMYFFAALMTRLNK